ERQAALRRAHGRPQRWSLDGLLVLRFGRVVAVLWPLHDSRSHRAGASHGTVLRLSGVLGGRLTQDGLQRPLPAATAARPRWLEARGILISANRLARLVLAAGRPSTTKGKLR